MDNEPWKASSVEQPAQSDVMETSIDLTQPNPNALSIPPESTQNCGLQLLSNSDLVSEIKDGQAQAFVPLRLSQKGKTPTRVAPRRLRLCVNIILSA